MSKTEITTHPLKFHFYSLYFSPLKDLQGEYSSTRILRDVITFLSQERLKGNGLLINKNANRKNEFPRELFVTSSVFKPKEQRILCSIALLRSGKLPKIKPTDKFLLFPIDTSKLSIAEETHFYIDYSKDHAVLCVEYNYWGPRMADIEYYLRQIAQYNLKLSRSTNVEMYMDNSIDKTLADLKNVLNIEMKIPSSKFKQLDSDIEKRYFSGMNEFNEKVKPNYIKIEALFQTPGKNIISSELNNEANGMIQYLLTKFKERPDNIDCFENFVIKYEDKDGNEDFFNLLKGKKEIVKEIDLDSLKKKRDLYALIENDFDNFMETL